MLVDIELLEEHPLAGTVPELREEEFTALVESISRVGIRKPVDVVEKDGKYLIIDGVHRVRAARIVGLRKVPVQIHEFPDEQIEQFIIDMQYARRNLTPEQRAAYAVEWAERNRKSDKEAAKRFGVSIRLFRAVKSIRKTELYEMIKEGFVEAKEIKERKEIDNIKPEITLSPLPSHLQEENVRLREKVEDLVERTLEYEKIKKKLEERKKEVEKLKKMLKKLYAFVTSTGPSASSWKKQSLKNFKPTAEKELPEHKKLATLIKQTAELVSKKRKTLEKQFQETSSLSHTVLKEVESCLREINELESMIIREVARHERVIPATFLIVKKKNEEI